MSNMGDDYGGLALLAILFFGAIYGFYYLFTWAAFIVAAWLS